MVVTQPEEITKIYRDVISFPVATSAHVTATKDGKSTLLTMDSLWSQRDLERKSRTTFMRSHAIDLSSNSVLSTVGPREISSELWNKLSPSGELRAVVRTEKNKKNEDRQYLEIYDNRRKLKTVDILALDKHGKIVGNDGHFGSFEWSSSDGHILYVAEKKEPASGSFFDPKAFKDGGSGDEDNVPSEKSDEIKRGDEFLFKDNWGEQLVERCNTVLCVLDVETSTVCILENLPETVSPGLAIWGPDDAGVVVCAWDNEPYRLGLKHCCQRKSALFYIDIQKSEVEVLSEAGRAVRFPYFSPDMARLVYLDVPEGTGPHNQCTRLITIDWMSRERKTVVDIVNHSEDDDFPGLYFASVARNIWFDDSVHLALETNWRSKSAVVVIDTNTGKIQRLVKEAWEGSMNLLCVMDNTMVVQCSAVNQPWHLMVGKVADPSDIKGVAWIYPDGQPDAFNEFSWNVLRHFPSKERIHPKYEHLGYESILCLPKRGNGDSLPPLIVFSHGGPNAAFDTSFNMGVNVFCRCGYAVVMVNYRGSVGFGQDSVKSLLGNIGDQDVKDVESVMVEILVKDAVDGNKVFGYGGSHGGFLNTHLIGQYPDSFKAISIRNPVINLTSMYTCSDIGDWVFAQSGLQHELRSVADDKVLSHLWSMSPISYIDQVKTPVLLMIGLDDKRVPTTQGLEYWRALKARGVPVRHLTYPGNDHRIDSVYEDADCMMNTLLWFGHYL